MNNNLNQEINSHLEYIMKQLEENLTHIDQLEQNIYFEMTKEPIVDSFNKTLTQLKEWKKQVAHNNFSIIKREYKNLESVISELELCLTDYDNLFHIEGISYAFYEIGKMLINKESDLNGR